MKANNLKPERIVGGDTPSSSDSVVVESYMNFNLPHNTVITADHGHDYQKELFFYFCLIFNNRDDCEWRIGFEVKDSAKFDDIVAEFEIDGKKYCFLIQAKHSANTDKIVTRDHILSQAKKKTNLEKNFEINQYYEAVKKDKRSSDRKWMFSVLTNQSVDLDDPPPNTLDTIEETDPVFNVMFEEMKNSSENDIKIIKFTNKITLNDGLIIDDAFFLDNFTYISQLPNIQELTSINNSILTQKYNNFATKNFSKVRNNVFKSLSVTKDLQGNLTRNPMTKKEFIKIIQNSVLELDFPAFSVDFCNQFNWLHFSTEALKIEYHTKYFCKGNAKLFSFMVYKALSAKFKTEGNQKKIFCIPFSKLTEIYRESLKVFEHKVVVYVEKKDPQEDYTVYKNAIFIFRCTDDHPEAKICSFEDLNEECKDHLLKEKITFQGLQIEIHKITENPAVLTEILQEMFDKQPLKLGSELPKNEMPKYYIDRLFKNDKTKEENIREQDIYEAGQDTIIQGLAGVGKSAAMLKVAKIIKVKYPELFVHFIDLKAHSDVLNEIKKKGIEISHDQDKRNTVHAWEFVKAHFLGINYKEKDQKVEELLLEHYVKEEKAKIVLFLDGFDEISPLYSEQIIQIIEGLKVKKIQIFLSSQSHLRDTIDQLGFSKQYTLEPYNRNMQREFLRQYWGYNLNKMIKDEKVDESDVEKQNIHAYTKKFFKMCYRSKLTDITPSIPLMLNILADTYLNECMEFCKKTNNNWSENILEVDVLQIYESIFRENCKKFYKKTEEKASNVYITLQEEHIFDTVRQTHMEIAAKNLLRSFWKEEEALDVEKRKYEIYGRGFITGNKDGEYIFIYNTFKNFFAADWFTRKIFPTNRLLDIDMLKCLLKKDDNKKKDRSSEQDKTLEIDRDVTSFIYRFMLKKLKEMKEKLKIEQNQEESTEISDFILSFFHYAWFNREISQLEIVFDMAKTFCPSDKVKEVCKGKKLLETLPFTSSAQLQLAVEIYDYYFGPEVTNSIMKNRNKDKILSQIVKEVDFQLYKEYIEFLTKRNIVTKQENLPQYTYDYFRNYLKKQKVSSWMFAKDLLLWHYEQLNTRQEEILSLMQEILKDENFKERHFLGHSLASFWDWKGNNEDFLITICKEAESKKYYYKFLYALNSITREDILEKAIEVMRQNGCRFVCHDGKSVLCHAFENNNNYLVEKLLKLLHKKEIEAQIGDEVCGGNSIIRQCTTENALCVIFIRYMLDNFGKERKDIIQEFFTPMKKGKEQAALESNVKFLNTMIKKDIKVEKGKIEECMNKLWSEAVNKDVNLLHVIAKEGKYVEVVEHVFNYLQTCSGELLLKLLQRVDKGGNMPCHLASKGATTIFLDQVEKLIPIEEISKLFSIKNKDKVDVFDIIYDNASFPRSGEDYFIKYGCYYPSKTL